MEEGRVSYNAVAPVYGGAEAEPVAEAAAADPNAPPLSAAQQRLAALKAKMSGARNANHKAVVAEDRRNKLGPEGLKAERAQRAKEQDASGDAKGGDGKAGGPSAEEARLLETTSGDAFEKGRRADKKQKRRTDFAWEKFNNEAGHRHYKRQLRCSEHEGRLGPDGAVDDGEPDPLAHGEAPPVSRERVEALVEDMHDAAVRRANWSRRRTFHEEKDVTYINKRNEVYNKKIERAFDPYTAEIRANLERGTAL